MKILRHIAFAAVLLSLATGAVAAANPDQLQVDAYTAVVQGDQARDHGDWGDAVRSYGEAATFYRRLAADAPKWHPDIVQYRLSYCANEIAAIVSRSGRTETELLAAPAVDAPDPTEASAQRVDELSSQNDALRADASRLTDEVAGLHVQLAGMSNQVAKMLPANQVQIASLTADNAKLGAELEKARKHSTALRETIDLQEKELQTIDELRAQVDALKSEKDGLRAEMKEARASEDRMASLKADSEGLGMELEKARKDSIALREAIAMQEKELKKMDELRAQADALKSENERMASLKTGNENLGVELEKARNDAIALRETIALQEKELKKLDELRARADALKSEKDRLYAEMKKARDELDQAVQEKRVMKLEALVTNLRAEVKMARDEEAKLRERIATLEKELAWLKRK